MLVMILIVVWIMYTCECDKKKMVDAVVPAIAATPAPTVTTPAQAAEEKKEGFCPKLAQRHGMCAGAESMNSQRGTFYAKKYSKPSASFVSAEAFEPMRSAPVGRGTMYERTQRASVLPI